MSDADRERWDARYRERELHQTPSRFALECAPYLPAPAAGARALDIACGDGRHAVWLAQRGLAVTGVDISPVGLAHARRAAEQAGVTLSLVELDLDTAPLPVGPWDVVFVFHYLARPRLAEFARAAAPGGLFLFAQPTVQNLTRHPQPSRRFLLEPGELLELTVEVGLETLHYREEWNEEGRHEAELLARNRGKPGS